MSAIKRVREIRLTRTALAHSKTRTSWAAALPVAADGSSKIPQTGIMDEVPRTAALPLRAARGRPVLAGPRHPQAHPARRGHLVRGRPAGARALPRRDGRAGVRDRAARPTAVARALQYSTTEGDPQLRALLAQRLDRPGPGRRSADEILVTTGSQQALGLVASVLLDPGDVVLVENPSYLAALQSFGFAGARMVPAPVRRARPRPRGAARRSSPSTRRSSSTSCRRSRTRPAARCRPSAARGSRRSPPSTGSGSSRTTRTASCATTASRSRRSRRTPAPRDRTVTVSSLSKVLAPGLRIGFLRAPEPLLGPLTVAKQAADLHTSTVDQHAARICLQTGDLDDHIALICAEYRRRRDALLGGLADALPEGSTLNHPDGGMFVWARLPEGWDASELLRRGAAPRRRVRPRRAVLRDRPRPAHAAPVVHDAPPRGDRRGARSGCARAAAARMTERATSRSARTRSASASC